MADVSEPKDEDDLAKAIIALHENVGRLLSVFIPILGALFVGFQNAGDNVEVLGSKFTPSQGAVISALLIVVACYFSARDLFMMRTLLYELQNKSIVQKTLQASAVLLNPFTEVSPPFVGRIFNYSALMLMHIAPIGVVLGFSDLIIAAQRSLILATLHFVLVLLFGIIYFFFYHGLVGVIDIVNPTDSTLRRRILKISIAFLVVAFLMYGHIANLENFWDAMQDLIKPNR